jgi:peptide/nickel transport system substrate-binding protein
MIVAKISPDLFRNLATGVAFAVALATAPAASAEPTHGIAMYGDPALPPDFVSLPYANPDAPKGGRFVQGENGSFDSLNPFILKGAAATGVSTFVFETLMGRSWDEPFTLYCLLCESVETGPNRDWVEFTLRPEARFSDGSPVTVEDVAWTYETLGTLGHPRYHTAHAKIASTDITGERSIRFTFNAPDRELPLIMALRPILQKSQWEGRAFDESGFGVEPIGSGPYVIGEYEAGRFIRLVKNPDWWGKDLAYNRGLYNFDEIRFDYFGDGDILFEAFKSGEVMTYREGSGARWDTAYDFPRVASGEVVKEEIPHSRPSGLTGFVMNTRLQVFRDWRVREAMIQAFNYEFVSQTLNAGRDPRIPSYFGNSDLAAGPGPATPEEAQLLAAFAGDLPPGTIEGYALPPGEASERNRAGIGRAQGLLAEAGWTIQDGALKNAAGEPFTFEIVLLNGATLTSQIMDLYLPALERLGIRPTVTSVDSAQYSERTNAYDFGMAWYTRPASLSPGNELMLYFGRAGVTEPGTRNWMGMDSPAAEATIAAMLAATERSDAVAAARALDRVLAGGRYVIPVWFSPVGRIAHVRELRHPERLPLYGDWTGFQPDVWWWQE